MLVKVAEMEMLSQHLKTDFAVRADPHNSALLGLQSYNAWSFFCYDERNFLLKHKLD